MSSLLLQVLLLREGTLINLLWTKTTETTELAAMATPETNALDSSCLLWLHSPTKKTFTQKWRNPSIHPPLDHEIYNNNGTTCVVNAISYSATVDTPDRTSNPTRTFPLFLPFQSIVPSQQLHPKKIKPNKKVSQDKITTTSPPPQCPFNTSLPDSFTASPRIDPNHISANCTTSSPNSRRANAGFNPKLLPPALELFQ